MADGVTTQTSALATIPDATKIATDDAGAAGHVQLVKLAVSADGSATALTADTTDGLLVNLGGNNDVTVASLPLPSGAATSANQTTLIGHVDGIEALLGTIDADTSALAGAVAGSEVQVDVLTMPTVTVADGGSSLTVDNGGTFAVQAAQSGTWTVQPGNTANTTAWKVDASSAAVPVTDNSGSLTVDDGGSSLTVDGTVAVSGSVAVTGTFWQATQPVSGTVTANAGTGPFPVSDNAGSLTVDAPVATPVFVRLSDGASAISALPVTDNSGSLTVDGATTSYLSQTRISVTPTISAGSIYASGDAVGGLLTFSNAARASGGSITVQTVVIIDNDQELAPLELVLFDRTFTATADNAAFDPSDADLANCIGVVKVSDYASFNDNSVATRAGIGLAAKLDGTDLFGQLVVRSAPTYTATSDIIVIVQVIRD